jgi:uncharacterized protein RhaS with RHS repeats
LYYLQSRYYNPEWGRFINADGLIGVTGELLTHNMFAYCNNNPVNMTDPDGNLAILAALFYVAPVISSIAVAVMTYAPGIIQRASVIMATAGNQMAAIADRGVNGNHLDKVNNGDGGNSSSKDPNKNKKKNNSSGSDFRTYDPKQIEKEYGLKKNQFHLDV